MSIKFKYNYDDIIQELQRFWWPDDAIEDNEKD
mgnify:CR=1 FL=1